MKKTFILALSIILVFSLLFACQTTTQTTTQTTSTSTSTTTPTINYIDIPLQLTAKEEVFKGQIGDFAKSQIPTFKVFTLDNGIPVIVKINPANKIYNIQLVLRGGASLSTVENAGIEKLMLTTMARGSAKYQYQQIIDILDRTSSGISTNVTFDYSTYSLNTLDKYFDQTLPIWLDTLANPTFNESDFNKALSEMKMAEEDSKSNPYSLGILKLNQEFFKGTPYAANPDGTSYSLKKLTLDKVKKYYQDYFSSNRMFIVAVGNYNVDDLKAKLNKDLGSIKNNNVKFPEPFSFYGKVKNQLLKVNFSQSQDITYLRGDFAAPSMFSDDYMPFAIAMEMLSDLLFSIVREKYSACYTPMAYTRSFLAAYASIVIYKCSKTQDIKKFIDEAVTPLLKGMCMNQDPLVKEKFLPIENVLDIYKQLYINRTFEKQQTNAAIANQIMLSIMHYGDYRYYLLDIDRVQKVTADQIKAAIQKYLASQPIMWEISGDPAQIALINPNDFTYLGTK
ncbi:MAG: pitrilysin family protein [Spirochaetota bacterium]